MVTSNSFSQERLGVDQPASVFPVTCFALNWRMSSIIPGNVFKVLVEILSFYWVWTVSIMLILQRFSHFPANSLKFSFFST